MKLFVYNKHGEMTDKFFFLPDKRQAQKLLDIVHTCNPEKYAKAIYYTGRTKEPIVPGKPNKALLKVLRNLTGLSQKAFGKKYGIPVRTIKSWEAGDLKIPDYVLGLLKRQCGRIRTRPI